MTKRSSDTPWGLSPREQAVIDHLTAGLQTKEIAKTLGLSHRTVEFYRSQALERMGCPSNSIRAAVLWDRFAMGRDGGAT